VTFGFTMQMKMKTNCTITTVLKKNFFREEKQDLLILKNNRRSRRWSCKLENYCSFRIFRTSIFRNFEGSFWYAAVNAGVVVRVASISRICVMRTSMWLRPCRVCQNQCRKNRSTIDVLRFRYFFSDSVQIYR
jgi:hypothetical protein